MKKLIYESINSQTCERPSTAALVEKHGRYLSPTELREALGNDDVWKIMKAWRKNRAKMRALLQPHIPPIINAIDSWCETNSSMHGTYYRGTAQLDPMDEEENRRLRTCDYSNVTEYFFAHRRAMSDVIRYHVDQYFGDLDYDSRSEFEALQKLITKRGKLMKKGNGSEVDGYNWPNDVMNAAFLTSLQFESSIALCSLQQHWIQFGKPMKKKLLLELCRRSGSIAEPLSVIPMNYFKCIESKLTEGQEIPDSWSDTDRYDLAPFYNPTKLWIAKSRKKGIHTMELVEDIFDEDYVGLEPVKCAGRKPGALKWMRKRLRRVLEEYAIPELKTLNSMLKDDSNLPSSNP